MSDNNYREMYVSEASEHVDIINQALLKLEEEPNVREHVDLIFRSAHTIKGMSATMGYDQTRDLCKNIENIFDKIRKGESKVTPDLASALFKCIDLLLQMINDENKKVDLAPYLDMLEHPEEVHKVTIAESSSITKSPTIRVKMSDLDSLVNLVGELVISKMRVAKFAAEDGSDEARQVMMELDRLVNDLQYQSMKIRLVPIEQIFSRFTRLVRDTSNSLKKEVDLHMDSGGIELDRTVLDAITEPLLHILRNCVDHGIENPEERRMVGKPAKGNISLTAYRVGDQIAIKIQDDGKGIDLENIKAMALEKGLITNDEMKMSDDEAIRLIGTPGLSTAKEVTDVSGRGVGMDVVTSQVEDVGGNVKITTKKGKGTTMILTLPLSISIIGGLLVNVANQKYVLPLSSITTTVKVPKKDVKSVHGIDVFQLRDDVVPLVRVADKLDIKDHSKSKEKDLLTVVIVNKEEKPYGLVVDSFDRKQEIVIKRLGNTSNSSDSFTNATILPDGRVALILDPSLLV